MWARRSAAIVTMLLFALPVASLATVLLPSTASAAEPCTGQSDPVSGLRCDIGQGISNAAGAVTQSFADQAEQALTKWVADTAIWLLQQLANVVFDSTSPVLSVDWFRAHYADMVGVAWVVAPIFLLLGIVQAILRSDLGLLGRILGQLVVVALLTTGAVALAQLLIGTVDQLSGFVSRNSGAELHPFLSNMASVMGSATDRSAPGTVNTLPLAFTFLAAVLTILGAVLIWLELIARTLVIYAALLFFPVLLAAALWPRVSGMVQLLAEVLVAVVVSKFIIVVIVVAGMAALAATGSQNAGPSLLIGAGMLLVAAWAPWKFYRLMPTMEAAMVHQVGRNFHQGWQRARATGQHATHHTRRLMSTRSRSALKVAGQTAASAPAAAGAAAAGAATAGLATAVQVAGTGIRAVKRVGGVSMAGWQPHPIPPANGTPRNGPAEAPGFVIRPTDVTRNPRPAKPIAPPAGGGKP